MDHDRRAAFAEHMITTLTGAALTMLDSPRPQNCIYACPA